MSGPVDADALEAIRTALRRFGWIHRRDVRSEPEFEALAERLGKIVLRTDIVVDPAGHQQQMRSRRYQPTRPSTYDPEGLALHNDRPTADVLAWYCVRPEDVGGETFVTPVGELHETFSEEEIAALGRVHVGYANLDHSGPPMLTRPLVTGRPGAWNLFWAPWQLVVPEDQELINVLRRFERYVEAQHRRAGMAIRLEAGESLWIDNHRMMHGRGPLPANSRRHLVRRLISTAGG
jgi:hypothetical protein